MKKQYHILKSAGFRHFISIYHDGWRVNAYSVWEDDLEAEIDKLEADGYTLGYIEKEILNLERRLLEMKRNVIRIE